VEFLIYGTLTVMFEQDSFEYDGYFCKTLCSLLNHYLSVVIDKIKNIFRLLFFLPILCMLSN
jgi:hypothetical protein